MCAYRLAINSPDDNILILEKNENSLQDYIDDGYDDLFKWADAQSDPNYMYSFNSNGSNIWMGKGLGGCTLHFGL